MRGRFIVLEGPDGSGTTTHAGLLVQKLQEAGEDVILTQEPTNGPIGTFIRDQLSKGIIPATPLQMLFCADRAWHVEECILPALNAGKTVVSDRYLLSTLVYGAALGVSEEWLLSLNTLFIQPDIQVIALPSYETCLSRVNGRSAKDMLEADELQRKVYDGYKQYAAEHHIPILDTAGSQDSVSKVLFDLTRSAR